MIGKNALIRVLVALGSAGVLAGCNHDEPTPPVQIHTATVAAPPPGLAIPKPHQPVDQFGDGKYEVLVDILPGQYKTNGPGPEAIDKCYWARLKDFTGAVTSVNSMQYGANGPDVVVIEPGDKGFETRGCGIWMRVKP